MVARRRLGLLIAALLAAMSAVLGAAGCSNAGVTRFPQAGDSQVPTRIPGADLAWTRTQEPVTVQGSAMAQFAGAPLGELYVYSYRGGTWGQVPFQFDEVDASGAYGEDNGILDALDELTFMAGDLGAQAQTSQWIDDPTSKTYPRFEVRISDPLHPAEEGWLYVYRSPNLVPDYPDYVQWDDVNYRIEGSAYAVEFDPTVMAGIATLELNGSGVDVMDRMKIRIAATCYIGPVHFTLTLTEEDLADYISLVPNVDGAVRVGGGLAAASVWFYRSSYTLRAAYDVTGLTIDPCTSITIDSVRESTDWLDPAVSGMVPATYYDSNTPAGVPVDGVPDAVPASPLWTWSQVSGSRGSVVTAQDLSVGTGTLSSYYLDDSTLNGDDTGDQRSYADAGFVAENVDGLVALASTSYMLDPLLPNVGALYRSYLSNPLAATATAQVWEPGCEPVSGAAFSWLPLYPLVGEPVTFSATAVGTPPITYAWDLGDGTAAEGPTVTHSYAAEGSYTVALTATNDCGQQTVQEAVFVEQAYRLFLPGVLYNAP